jgi:hypothetical protein
MGWLVELGFSENPGRGVDVMAISRSRSRAVPYRLHIMLNGITSQRVGAKFIGRD